MRPCLSASSSSNCNASRRSQCGIGDAFCSGAVSSTVHASPMSEEVSENNAPCLQNGVARTAYARVWAHASSYF
eukprot:349939-Chlamydomonas_euryale.AAC.1